MKTTIGSKKSKKLPKKILSLIIIFQKSDLIITPLFRLNIDLHGNVRKEIGFVLINLHYRLNKEELRLRFKNTFTYLHK